MHGITKLKLCQPKLFSGSSQSLEAIFRIVKDLTRSSRVLGYKVENGDVVFGYVDSVNQLPLSVRDVQKPGYFRIEEGFRFRHSFASPKSYLYPSVQAIAIISRKLDVITLPQVDDENVVFFGIKPCDVKAIEILDRLNKNPIYSRRRKNIVAVIVEECLEPNDNCFCGAVGSGPEAVSGYDIAYARLSQDLIVFKYGSSLGEKILSELKLREADEDTYRTYVELLRKTKDTTSRRIVANIWSILEALDKSMSDETLWIKLSEKCIGCGNCNYVCPTCFCIEFDEVINDENSVRIAKWIGCLTYVYGMVAGGHFRPKLFMRYRHFILHKFLFYLRQINAIGCTGCGRCITWCPLGIDIRETLNTIAKRVVGYDKPG